MELDRPNILLMHSDQHRYDCVGVNGNSTVKTPALDEFAATAISFDHAFSTCPICTPARASLMTGAWPTTHRSLCIPTSDFWQPARRELPVLPALLRDAGYYVGMVGKYHGELEGGPTDHGVEDFVSAGSYSAWCAQNGIPEMGWEGGLFGAVNRDIPADKAPIAYQADRVIEQLEHASKGTGRGQPFFVRWDPPEPHLPCRPAAVFHDMYGDSPIPPWPSFPDPLEGKPGPQARQHTIWGTGGWTWSEWEPYVRLYLAQITELDHHVGRVLDTLDRLGLRQNTLVIYSTDHGDFAGGHGLMDKHFSMYDDILRVPLLIRPPASEPGAARLGNTRSAAFVSQEIDIARTILAAADVPAPPSFVGQDLLAVAAGRSTAREDIFAQYFGTESGMYSSRCIRNGRWKYVWNPLHIDELYDLANDPGELKNLIQNPESRDVIARLRRRLVEWMEEVGDRLCNRWTKVELLGETNAHEQSRTNTRPW